MDTSLVYQGKYFKRFSDFLIFLVSIFTIIGNIAIYISLKVFPQWDDQIMQFLIISVLTTNICAILSVILVQRNSEVYFDNHKGIDISMNKLGEFLHENDDLYEAFVTWVRCHKNRIVLFNRTMGKKMDRLEQVETEEQLESFLEMMKDELFVELRKELNQKQRREL